MQSRSGQIQVQVAQLQAERNRLLMNYTEQHPDVVRIDHQIRDLQSGAASTVDTPTLVANFAARPCRGPSVQQGPKFVAAGAVGNAFQGQSVSLSADGNTAIGDSALSNNTADNNTAIGSFALSSNTAATENTAIGAGALQNNTTGDSNTANNSATDTDTLTPPCGACFESLRCL